MVKRKYYILVLIYLGILNCVCQNVSAQTKRFKENLNRYVSGGEVDSLTTLLIFKTDSTFCFSFLRHIDSCSGRYSISNDTVYLDYLKTPSSPSSLLLQPVELYYKENMLYVIKYYNGKTPNKKMWFHLPTH